jgi:hypothetical protein
LKPGDLLLGQNTKYKGVYEATVVKSKTLWWWVLVASRVLAKLHALFSKS